MPQARKEPVPEEKTSTSRASGSERIPASGCEVDHELGPWGPEKPKSPLGSALQALCPRIYQLRIYTPFPHHHPHTPILCPCLSPHPRFGKGSYLWPQTPDSHFQQPADTSTCISNGYLKLLKQLFQPDPSPVTSPTQHTKMTPLSIQLGKAETQGQCAFSPNPTFHSYSLFLKNISYRSTALNFQNHQLSPAANISLLV